MHGYFAILSAAYQMGGLTGNLTLTLLGVIPALCAFGCALMFCDFLRVRFGKVPHANQEHVRRALRRRDAGFTGMRGSWTR